MAHTGGLLGVYYIFTRMETEMDPPAQTYTAKFWFSGLEKAAEFGIEESDYHRFRNYLAETDYKEFFEFYTPAHTVVLVNMSYVDAVKLTHLPYDDSLDELEEEPAEARIQLAGRFDAFFASSSQEHLGPNHPVRQLLEPETGKFVQWFDARDQIVVMNPRKLCYVEHPQYWVADTEEWDDNSEEAEEVDETEDIDEADEAEIEEEEGEENAD